MSGDTLNLQVTIVTPNGEVVVPVTPRASLPVAEFMARLIREYGLVGEPVNWQLIHAHQPLTLDRPLGEQLPPGPTLAALRLTPTGATLPRGIPGLSGSVRTPPERPTAPPPAVAPPPPPPTVIGKYRVIERLGGGEPEVYRCEHTMMRREVVLKLLPPTVAEDRAKLDQVTHELRSFATVDHPNLVRIYDLDQDGPKHFLVTERVDGINLHDAVTKYGPLNTPRACQIVRDVAAGLQHAHEAGLTHRDVRPRTILQDRSGISKLLDLGVAKYLRGDPENAADQADYRAPSPVHDSVDIRDDIYSLGATFYFLLTGSVLFPDGSPAQKLIWHQTREPKPIRKVRPEVPDEVIAIIDKMLAKNPADRYQTPAEAVAALAPWVSAAIYPPPERETLPPSETGGPGLSTASISPGAPRPAPMAPGAPMPAAAPAPSAASSERQSSVPRGRASTRVSPTADTAPLRKPKRAAEVAERRATVRYYSRMNPDRVFPLLVTLTREEVERVVKRDVEQTATGPLALATDTPLEVEPVLPGCQCHPPKIVTRLGDGNDVFTFHVVPHVLGDVTGARVVIRQDHATVAEIGLRVRVVQRTVVVASGLSTFVVPFASAAMKHFGLDFTPKDGSNPYLAALNFLFGQVSPVVLTVALAAVTLGLYWWTRPKGRDVFWDITTKPAN